MTIFFIGDTHFGHKNILTFKREDGSPLRSFASIEEMDEHLVKYWNSVVSDKDLVYHMGDVVMNRKNLHIVHRLKGRKILIRGNHDTAPTKELLEYFEEIYGTHCFKDIILSHIPISKESLERFGTNVHGHLHSYNINDPVYFNVSAEQIDYTPISLEELRKRIDKRKESFKNG
jgi:calcineurin-like phosphoesterase family protein